MATKTKKKPTKPKEKFLHRIDINLSYLHYSEKREYTRNDVLKWLKNDIHDGEFDDDIYLNLLYGKEPAPKKLKITLVEDKDQIKEFDETYSLYGPHEEGEIILDNAIDELNLHISVNEMITRLQKAGYKVSK